MQSLALNKNKKDTYILWFIFEQVIDSYSVAPWADDRHFALGLREVRVSFPGFTRSALSL